MRCLSLFALVILAVLALGGFAPPAAEAAGASEYRRPVELGGSAGGARLPLATAAGEAWRLRVAGALGATRLSVVDPRSGEIAAQTANAAIGLRWTAPQTGIWRIEIRTAGEYQRGTVTLIATQ